MTTRKSHCAQSACPLACALDIFGDHWTLLVVRDMLMFNRHEFSEFLQSGEGISTNILADRLERLMQAGIIKYLHPPGNKRRKLYYLTDAGKDLVHVIVEIGKWSKQWLDERVNIPAEILGPMQRDPESFKARLLENINRWERQHDIPH